MNADIFAEWLRRQKYRVVRTPSSYWCEASPRVYQAFPYHWVIDPSEEELLELIRGNGAIGLRYSTPVAAAVGMLSYHVVWEGSPYDLDLLPRQARQNIRKGLAYAEVEPISLSRLATEGWRLREQTLLRQGRSGAEDQTWWYRLCQSAEGLPGFEAWGAIHDGELVASLLTFRCDDYCLFPHQQSADQALRQGVNNSLFYIVTRSLLDQPGVATIFLSLQSLDAPESVDQFKFRMGYQARPVRQRVVFHPWLTPVLNPKTHALINRLAHWRPDDPRLSKVEGMIRFHLAGKRPPDKQEWPACLAEHRETLLKEVLSTPAIGRV
jgi:hypothetical protein